MVTSPKMKAIVSKLGPMERLSILEIDRPAVPDDGVLVRVYASSVNPMDLFPLTPAGYIMGGRKPQVLGMDFAGVVEAVGKSVTRFQPGDEVFGGARGAFAEYLCVTESGCVARKPAILPFEQAGVMAVAASTALQAIRNHGRMQAGQSVLINGASGGVGTLAVQIAKALGADVTAVSSTRNVEMIRSLGADAVIDYTKEDFTRGGRRFDLIIDIAGSHSLSECARVLEPAGAFVLVGVAARQHLAGGGLRALGHFLTTRVASIGRSQTVAMFIAKLTQDDITFLGELLGARKVTPAIDRSYELGRVSDALGYLNQGHARAKVAIRVAA